MKVLNKQELTILAILSYPKVARSATEMLRSHINLFSSVQSPHVDLMWKEYLKLRKKHIGKRLSKAIVKAELAERIQENEDMPPELIERCDYILEKFSKGEDVPSIEESNELLQTMVKGDVNRKLSRQISNDADIQEMMRTMNSASDAISELELQEKDDNRYIFNPFQEIDKLALHTTRLPTGINWMDEITSGGGRGGELWLFLGGSGGGKTVTAVQYSCCQALMGNTTVWATYEQSLEGDISERIISYVTDESLDKIRDIGFNNLPDDIQRKFWASVAGTNDKLVVLDMTKMKREQEADPQDYGGIYSIWKQVKKLKEEGKQVRTVLVDWIGAMMLRVAANTGKDLSNGFRFLAQHEIDVARDMVKKENIQVIFFHQIDSKTAAMRPTFCPGMTCAKDMHDMSNYMDIVITLGRRDTNNVCWISSAKSRRGAPISRTIQLIGEKSRFVTAKGWIPNRDGNFYKPSDDYQPDEPQSAGPAGNAAFSREID